MKVNPPAPPIPNISVQVKRTAMIIAPTTVNLPITTILCSVDSLLIYFLYISSVKMVEILFAFPASEATIAAVKAATANHFSPVGKNASTAEYAPSFPPSKPGNW